MQQFTVPQFIDVEDKIIGPITVRQFLIILTAFIIAAVFYMLFDFGLFLLASLLVFGIAAIFSFFRVNGMPFHYFVLSFSQTLVKPNLRVWDNSKTERKVEDKLNDIHLPGDIPKPVPLTSSRLTQLSLIVDTQGSFKGDDLNKIKNPDNEQ